MRRISCPHLEGGGQLRRAKIEDSPEIIDNTSQIIDDSQKIIDCLSHKIHIHIIENSSQIIIIHITDTTATDYNIRATN